jgi:hypothetical protein
MKSINKYPASNIYDISSGKDLSDIVNFGQGDTVKIESRM